MSNPSHAVMMQTLMTLHLERKDILDLSNNWELGFVFNKLQYYLEKEGLEGFCVIISYYFSQFLKINNISHNIVSGYILGEHGKYLSHVWIETCTISPMRCSHVPLDYNGWRLKNLEYYKNIPLFGVSNSDTYEEVAEEIMVKISGKYLSEKDYQNFRKFQIKYGSKETYPAISRAITNFNNFLRTKSLSSLEIIHNFQK